MLFRHELAVAISVCIAILVMLQSLYNPLIVADVDLEAITAHHLRLEPLRMALTPGAAIGYASDVEGEVLDDAFFRLTQYALAPVIVEKSITHETLIGYFTNTVENFCQNNNRSILKAFPDGIYLLGRSQ